MHDRPTVEEFSRHAARHVMARSDEEKNRRIEKLSSQGVHDEESLARHVHDTMTAEDSLCFRGAFGREAYANDRTNTIVITNDGRPGASTVFNNDRFPEKTASQRLGEMAAEEHGDYPRFPCEIRPGGTEALEADRRAEARQGPEGAEPGERRAPRAAESPLMPGSGPDGRDPRLTDHKARPDFQRAADPAAQPAEKSSGGSTQADAGQAEEQTKKPKTPIPALRPGGTMRIAGDAIAEDAEMKRLGEIQADRSRGGPQGAAPTQPPTPFPPPPPPPPDRPDETDPTNKKGR
ncbi:MAG TPA: hypothetical protein VFZ91_00190 [Allosphingosinicella sp.]